MPVGLGLILVGPRLGLVPVLWVLAGLYFLTWGIVSAVNRTTVKLTVDAMEVLHGPLPWVSSWKIPLADIQSVTVSSSSRNTGHPAQGGTFRHYGLVVEASRRRYKLGQGVASANQAEEIRMTITRHLEKHRTA